MVLQPRHVQLMASVSAATAQHATSHLTDPSKQLRAVEMACYTSNLASSRVTLHTLARLLLSHGHALLSSGAPLDSSEAPSLTPSMALSTLGALEGLLAGFVEQWAALTA